MGNVSALTSTWLPLFSKSAQTIADFIRDGFANPNSNLADYFNAVQAQYGNEENDRLLIAINFLNAYVAEKTEC